MRTLFFLICGLLPLLGGAQDSAYARVLERWQREHHFSGTVLISRAGRLIWTGATGLADREKNKAIRTTTPFRIAGLTNTFTAVMVLQLQEEGLLRIDDTIGKHLPGYRGPGRDRVTIYQLLTHSSGIPDCGGGTALEIDRKPLSLDTFISRFCSGPLLFEPGSRSKPSNGDYILLGKIIENASGRTYTDNLERRILRPLRMNGTGPVDDANPVFGLARPYSFRDSVRGLVADPYYVTGNYFGAGALYSTGFDLLRFDAGLFGRQLLRAPTMKQLLQGNEKLGGVALGFWYAGGKGTFEKPYVYRPGAIRGSRASWIHVLDGDMAIIVLSNTDRGDLTVLSQELYRVSQTR
jgi:CubicO group peptidase (beta-lactamase class C family)